MPVQKSDADTIATGFLNEQHVSLIQKIDPRARVVAPVFFALAVVLSDQIAALITALVISIVMAFYIASLPLVNTLKRLAAMDMFMLYLLLVLPFSIEGEQIAEVFGFSASWQGLLRAIEIALKANTVVLMLFACVSSLSHSALGSALVSLKVSNKLIQLLLFTVRYLSVIKEEYHRLRRSMRARSFVMGFNWHSWKSMGHLIGMLLVRSLARAERIVNAMKCRGYQGVFISYYPLRWQHLDSAFCLSVLVIVSVISGVNFVGQ